MKTTRLAGRTGGLLILSVGLAGCGLLSDWTGASEDPLLPGERIAVMSLERTLEPDPAAAALPVRLPVPRANESWPQTGGGPGHALRHVVFADAPAALWQVDIGSGSGGDARLLAPPVVAGGRVFAMDAESVVSAIGAAAGRVLWTTDTAREAEGDGFGGGLAAAGGRVFAATGFGDVLALDAETGAVQWRRTLGIPMRAPPAAADGRVFVVTHDNRLWALDAATGTVQWSHAGIAETARLLGGASPAVEGEVVVAPYSSGEIAVLRVENGRAVWADTLASPGVLVETLASFNDIVGSPAIDRGVVFAIGQGGPLVAIDLRTGGRVWEREVAGREMPWSAGDVLFVTTGDGEVVCLSREDGAIRWVRPLPRFADPEERDEPLFWTGPILAGGRLIVLGSDGAALSISPHDGSVLGRFDLPGGARLPPVVADGTLFVLTEGANLVALR